MNITDQFYRQLRTKRSVTTDNWRALISAKKSVFPCAISNANTNHELRTLGLFSILDFTSRSRIIYDSLLNCSSGVFSNKQSKASAYSGSISRAENFCRVPSFINVYRF